LWIVFGFLTRVQRLNDSLNEYFSFRQTQTAFGIKYFAAESWNPFTATVPVLGPPWKIPFEFPIFQFFSSLPVRFFSIEPGVSGRLLATIFFLTSAVLIFLILDKTHGLFVAKISMPLFLLTSFSLQWSSAVLIDWLSVALVLGGIYFCILHEEKGKNFTLTLLFAMILLAAASLTKITTTIPWVISFVIYLLYKRAKKINHYLTLITAISLTFVPTFMWNMFADDVKSQNPFTKWLQSDELTLWNFGTLNQRFVFSNWLTILGRIDELILGSTLFIFTITVVSLFLTKIDFSKLTFYCLVSLLGPLIFFNLYLVHDYYLIAIYPAIIALLAIFVSQVIELVQDRANSKIIGALLVGVIIFLTYVSPIGRSYVSNFRNDNGIPVAAQMLSTKTFPESNLFILGCEWDPTLLYFANRKGLMLMPGRYEASELSEKLIQDFDYVYFCGDVSWEAFPKSIKYTDEGENLYKLLSS
jgi:hypothetical protein